MNTIATPLEALPVMIIVVRFAWTLFAHARKKTDAAEEDREVPEATTLSEDEFEVVEVAGEDDTRYMLVPVEGDYEDTGQKKPEASNHSGWTYLSDLVDHLDDWNEEVIGFLMRML